MGEYTVEHIRYVAKHTDDADAKELLTDYAALLERQASDLSDEPTDRMVDAALALQGEDALLAKAPALTSAIVKIYKAMRAVAPVQASAVPGVNDMVNRFLGWTLPKDFRPDAGISYNPAVNINHTTGEPYPNTPSGTNLFTAEQAEQMILHMLSATPQPPKVQIDLQAVREVIADLRFYNSNWSHALAEKLIRAIGDTP